MIISALHVKNYLIDCIGKKHLNEKTVKAYRIDLAQFLQFALDKECDKEMINTYLSWLHTFYTKPKTIKRKIATVKAFLSYLEFNEYLLENPFKKISVKFREPLLLPRTIPLDSMKRILHHAYLARDQAHTQYQKQTALRNICVIELLFSTGVRVSELCNIKLEDMNLKEGYVRIFGKGSKERNLTIGSTTVLLILKEYLGMYQGQLMESGYFFVNRLGSKLSEQSVRILLRRYAEDLRITQHITPHMIRHTFATQLLEEDVDIRFIQKILGHSSITTTQIYTHVSNSKQKQILIRKNPRNLIKL